MKSILPFYIKFLFTFLVIFSFISCEKNSTPANRGGGGGNTDVKVISNIQNGTNKDLLGNTVSLTLDVYIPPGATASQKFPFVLFVHGGGFTAGDKSTAATALEQFAEAGYVGVAIDYRLDSSIDALTDPCSVDSITTEKAVYMAVEDTKAAMRYMVANAAKYNIDTSKIFLDGNSAGAITVLNSYFLTQTDFNVKIPGVETELGGINNADNNLTNTFKIVSIAANSGCLFNPDYITSSNVIPIIFFCGGQDSVIPIEHGNAYYCSNTVYVYGSITLYDHLLQLGESAVLHVDPDGGHGPYTQDFLATDEICFFNSVLNRKAENGSYSSQQSSCN